MVCNLHEQLAENAKNPYLNRLILLMEDLDQKGQIHLSQFLARRQLQDLLEEFETHVQTPPLVHSHLEHLNHFCRHLFLEIKVGLLEHRCRHHFRGELSRALDVAPRELLVQEQHVVNHALD